MVRCIWLRGWSPLSAAGYQTRRLYRGWESSGWMRCWMRLLRWCFGKVCWLNTSSLEAYFHIPCFPECSIWYTHIWNHFQSKVLFQSNYQVCQLSFLWSWTCFVVSLLGTQVVPNMTDCSFSRVCLLKNLVYLSHENSKASFFYLSHLVCTPTEVWRPVSI